MVNVRDYEDMLRDLGRDYFIEELQFVPDIVSWAKENNRDLSEPHLPMKLIVKSEDSLSMVIQEHIHDEILADVIKNLGIRWSVRDNVTDIDQKFNSLKKRLAYCFLKEYAMALDKTGGDGLSEDEWVAEEMEYLGFFKE
jgi:hypothetical protein